MSRDLTRPRDQRVTYFYGWELLIVNHHHAKFDGHRHDGCGDINIPANAVIYHKCEISVTAFDRLLPPL